MIQDDGPFSLNPELDLDAYADAFRRTGRVAIRDVLVRDDAERILANVRDRADWIMVFNRADKTYEISRAARGELPPQDWRTLETALAEAARWGFQYR